MKRFGEKLYTPRRSNKLSQRQLGDMLGISGSHIGSIERGEKLPNALMILKIADIFKVTIDQLMRDELEVGAFHGE
ncbi:helix-turn-helix domain-containing protein [Chloroflexi bacterium TSY]|nr:helix-turn-helix domain-containing protein [Chloroflexi bacterium TSY]